MAESRPNAGTHQPDTTLADFRFWAKMTYWTVKDASALLIGLNPQKAKRDILDFNHFAPYSARFYSLQDLANRAYENKQLTWPLTPARWVEWAKRMDIAVDPELESESLKWDAANSVSASVEAARIKDLEAKLALATKEIHECKDRDAKVEKALGTRERETVLKIIIAMAVKGYSYDPKTQRSDKIKDIENDTDACGVRVTDDTIRRYLREAAALLPPTELP